MRVLVHLGADAVPAVPVDDAVPAGPADRGLDGVARCRSAGRARRRCRERRRRCRPTSHPGPPRSSGSSRGAIAPTPTVIAASPCHPVQYRPAVHRDDVALAQHHARRTGWRARSAHSPTRRSTRIAVEALERRNAPRIPNDRFGQPVEIRRADPRERPRPAGRSRVAATSRPAARIFPDLLRRLPAGCRVGAVECPSCPSLRSARPLRDRCPTRRTTAARRSRASSRPRPDRSRRCPPACPVEP